MKRLMSMVAGAALAAVLMAPTADAQQLGTTRAVTFGIGGGASLPVGDLGDAFNTGWHGQAMLGFNALGIQMRIDGMYHSLPEDGHDHDLRVIAGVLNANFMLAPGAMVQPYLSAGVGIYNLRLDEDDPDFDIDTTEFGINGGGGLRFNLAGLSTFVEARYHYIFTDGSASTLIPITVGITF